MTPRETAEYILSHDAFMEWKGIKLIDIKEKYCLIEMPIRAEMINALKTVHGGVTFSLADSALALSSNNTGHASVALNCVISFSKAARMGDVLRAESKLITETKKTGIYDIFVRNQDEELIAIFKGTVYKLNKNVTDL